MKKVSIIIFILSIGFQVLKAETINDSLSVFLNNIPKDEQVDTLRKMIVSNLWKNPNLAIKYVKRFKTLEAINDNPKNMVQYNFWMGLLYEMFGDYKTAIEYDFKALEKAKEADLKYLIAASLNNIGILFRMQIEYSEKALYYFHQCLSINKEIGDDRRVFGAYTNLAYTFDQLNQIDSASHYFRLAYKLGEKMDDKRIIALSLANQSMIFLKVGDTASFKKLILKSIEINRKSNYIMNLGANYYTLTRIFIDQGITDSALYYTTKLDKLAIEHDLNNYKVLTLKHFARINQLNGNYKEAYNYIDRYHTINDSINGRETDEKIGRMQTLYEVKLKDKEIVNLKMSEHLWKQKAILFLVLILALIIIAAMIIFVITNKRKKDKVVSMQKQVINEKEKKLIQLELEKSKIKEEELKTKIKTQTRQLTTHALNMLQKNQLMQEMSPLIKEISKESSNEQRKQLKSILSLIRRNLHLDKDWDLFKLYFEQLNANFYDKLLAINKSLTSNDLKLCALSKLNLNIKETAAILNIEPDSVKRARYRLRKKLGINNPEIKLSSYLNRL
jgi:tetratricopeptide (TPR) repeat protein